MADGGVFLCILLTIIFVPIYCYIKCCKCDDNYPTVPNEPDRPPIARREIFVVCIDETPNRSQQRNQSATAQNNSTRTNEIPPEYSNIKPQQNIDGWTQGSGLSNIPSDARVPQNAQPPTIMDDD